MSKATIVDNLGEGLYAVTLDYDTAEMDRAISALQAKLAETEADLLAAQDALIALTEARQSAAADLDDAILAYKQALADDPASADSGVTVEATKALAAASQAVSAQQRRIDVLIARKLALARRITFLQNSTGTQQPSAGTLVWCADYSEDADGTVPVAIVPGEQSTAPLVILPRQHPDGWAASYDREQFGQLVPRMSMTPAAAFYNWAMLPGWQRWMPQFRIGTVTFVDIETDTCNLTLEDAKSSAGPYPFSNGLSVNLAESTTTEMSGVPIRYMTCNAAVFEVGDRVLVRFKGVTADGAGAGNWGSPEVIGFVSQPRPCDVFYSAFDTYIFGDFSVSGTSAGDIDSIHADFSAEQSILIDGQKEETQADITATADYESVASTSGTGDSFRQSVTVDFSYSSVISLPGNAQQLPLIDFTGHWEYLQIGSGIGSVSRTWGPSSMTMIARDISKINATGDVYFATVHHLVQPEQTVIETPGQFAQMTRYYTAYDVVAIDGIEYIVSEDSEELTLSITTGDASFAIVAPDTVFEGYVDPINPSISYVITEQMKPKREFLDYNSAGYYPSSFTTLNGELTNNQKERLRQARAGELPVLSI